MMMMIDAFQPQGVTMIAVDSIFMMPHLGVLSTINEQAATEVFEKDCLINLGTCVSLANTGKPGSKCLDYRITLPDGQEKSDSLLYGELKLIDLKEGETAEIEITPTRQFDVGRGKGQKMEEKVSGGVVGLVIDVRGRPLSLHKDKVRRIEQIKKWNKAFRAYPD
jgi:hypothetical protein